MSITALTLDGSLSPRRQEREGNSGCLKQFGATDDDSSRID
ncbi:MULTISPECIES: hypothetical protein [Yimella]|nr:MULTISPECIES: hypothetical protein [Yimella]